MLNQNAPFTLTLLPSRRSPQSETLHLSIYVDLNRAYADLGNFDAWYDVVRRFHLSFNRPSLFDLLCTQIERVGIRFHSDASNVETVHRGKITARPSAAAISFWNTSFVPGTYVQANRLPAPSALAFTHRTDDLLVGTERQVRPLHEQTTFAAISSMLRTGSMSGARPLNALERAQISLAATNQTSLNHGRLVEALRDSEVKATFGRTVDDSLSGLAAETVALAELTSRKFARSIEYMWYLFDLLTPSPDLRRLFGLIIDFSLIDRKTVGSQSSADLLLGATLADGQKKLADWFDSPSTSLISLATDERDTIVAEDDTPLIQNGILHLENARVVCFDPQSAAHSADEGMRDLNEIAHSGRTAQDVLNRHPAHWETMEAHKALSSVRDIVTDSTSAASAVRTNLAILRTERSALTLLARFDKRIANTSTGGLTVYHTDPDALIAGIGGLQDSSDTTKPITAGGAIRGFVIYVRHIPGSSAENSTPSPWMSLTTISESVALLNNDGTSAEASKWTNCEMGIHVGGGVRGDSDRAEAGSRSKSTKVIRDGFILSWPGTGLSCQSPLRHHERGEGATATDAIRESLLAFERSHDLHELEALAAQMNASGLLRVVWIPSSQIVDRQYRLTVFRNWADPGGAPKVKLFFNRADRFQFIACAQYHNGYFSIDDKTLNNNPKIAEAAATPPTQFVRYDHIRDTVVAFERDIYKDRKLKILLPESAGESERDLVVRSGESLDNDTCVRVLLPPPLPTFQTYLWYQGADLKMMGPPKPKSKEICSRVMSERELANWYERYTCDAHSKDDFEANRQRAIEKNRLCGALVSPVRGCSSDCASFCGGLTQPPVYRNKLYYVPDPVVTGLRFEFFSDSEFAIPATNYASQDCFFCKGDYPNLHGWRLQLEKVSSDKPLVQRTDKNQKLIVRLAEGHRLYVRATPMHRPSRSHFADSLLDEHGFSEATRIIRGADLSADNIADPLHANVVTFVLTHATQRPIVTPIVHAATVRRFNPMMTPGKFKEPPTAAMFEADIDVTMEWLNLLFQLPVPEVAPTGELELFAIWDDYDDHHDGASVPLEAKIDSDTQANGFVRVARLGREDFSALSTRLAAGPLMGPGDVHRVRVTFRSDHAPFTVLNHTRMRFRIRNSSQFYSFFHSSASTQSSNRDVEQHSRWSKELSLTFDSSPIYTKTTITAPFMANNVKPQKPEVVKIVALVMRDDYKHKRIEYHGNRIRLYLSTTGRQSTGPERIGIIVNSGLGKFGFFEGRLSQGGQDIVTDGPAPIDIPPTDESWLRSEHFVYGDNEVEPEYRQSFEPRYEADLFSAAPGVGLVSYRPRFSNEENLWYVDVQLAINRRDGAELHNAMVKFALVTYQPHGANYGSPELDYRISETCVPQIFSLYPTRVVGSPLVLFEAAKGRGCILSAAISSLFFRQLKENPYTLRTQFVAEVQQRADGQAWKTIPSRLAHIQVRAEDRELQGDLQHPPTLSALRHLLLPEALPVGSPESRFECEFKLEFDHDFFDFLGFAPHRLLIREIDWFPFEADEQTKWATLQNDIERHDPAQIHDLRVRQIILLTAR